MADETKAEMQERLEDFVILPGRSHEDYEYPDTLIGTRLEKYSNWKKAQIGLCSKGYFLPTIRQYLDFWIMLCDGPGVFRKIFLGNGKKASEEDLDRIRDGFLKGGFKVEHLDARFLVNHEKRTYMLFEHRLNDGVLLPSQVVEIDFQSFGHGCISGHYLRKFNKYGLPTRGALLSTDEHVCCSGYREKTKGIEAISIGFPSSINTCMSDILLKSKAVAQVYNTDAGCVGLDLEYCRSIDKDSEHAYARPCKIKR